MNEMAFHPAKATLTLTLIAFFALAYLGPSPAPARASTPNAKPLHVVFDIDDTFAFKASDIPDGPNLLKLDVMGRHYVIPQEFVDSVEALLKMSETSRPPIKISFFSAGTTERNHELLSKIKLSDGRSMVDIAEKILSRSNLVDVSRPSAAPEPAKPDDRFRSKIRSFAGQLKKNIELIDPNLSRVLIVDNERGYVAGGQEKNYLAFLWTPQEEKRTVHREWKRVLGLIYSTAKANAEGQSVRDFLPTAQFTPEWSVKKEAFLFERIGQQVYAAFKSLNPCAQKFSRLGTHSEGTSPSG